MTAETRPEGETSSATTVPNPPASNRRMVGFSVAALVAGIAVVLCLSRIGRDTQAGFLRTMSEAVTAGRQARITQVLVKPGDTVKPGTPLLVLKDATLEANRIAQQNSLAALEAELRQAKAKASVEIADRKAKLEAEVFDAQLKLAAFEERRFDFRLSFLAAENRVMLAQAENLSSEVQVAWAGKDIDMPFEPLTLSNKAPQSKNNKRDYLHELHDRESTRNKLEASEAQVGLCEERLTLLKKQLDGVPAQINEAFGVNVIETKIKATQEALAKIDEDAPTLTITAQKYGTVGLFGKGCGEMVGPLDVIVEVFDADQPYVMLEISSSLLAQYPAHSEVELIFPGNIVRKGQISDLPPQAAMLPGPHTPIADTCGKIRLTIRPVGQLWPVVPIGSSVQIRKHRSDFNGAGSTVSEPHAPRN